MSIAAPDVEKLLRARNRGVRRLGSTTKWSHTKLQRVPIDGRGYGVVAASPIAEGEFLGISNALGVVYEDEVPLPEKELQSLPFEQRAKIVNAKLARDLHDEVHECYASCTGSTLRQLFSLFDDSAEGYGLEANALLHSPSSEAPVEITTRLGLGADGVAALPEQLRKEIAADEDVADNVIVSEQRIHGIISVNSDDVWCFPREKSSPSSSSCHRRIKGVALFGAPSSWLNHSFGANVVVTTICDSVLLWAGKAINVGEELTRPYIAWDWDQDVLGRGLARFGIALKACVAECSRLLPRMAVTDRRWTKFCHLLATIEDAIRCSDGDAKLEKCEAGFEQALEDWGEVLHKSFYLHLRVQLLLCRVRRRQHRLGEALFAAEQMIGLLPRSEAPASEYGRYCSILLSLGAALYRTPPREPAPAHHGSWSEAIRFLLETAELLALAFLGTNARAFKEWVCCWPGAEPGGLLEPLLALLPVDDSTKDPVRSAATVQESPKLELDAMD